MSNEKLNSGNLSDNLKKLSKISEWFESQKEVDVEEGLKRVKEAVVLIKASKERLRVVENEFEEIKREVNLDDDKEEKSVDSEG